MTTTKLSKKAIINLLMEYDSIKSKADDLKAQIDDLVKSGVINSDMQLSDTLLCKYYKGSVYMRFEGKLVQQKYPKIYEECKAEHVQNPYIRIMACKPKNN